MTRIVTPLCFCILFLLQINLYAQTEFVLRSQAQRLSKSCFSVTLDQTGKAGAIWWPNKVDLTKPLDLHFVMYFGNKNDSGADGLAFVMHNDTRQFDATGEVGGGLYFGDHPSQPDASNPGIGRTQDNKIRTSVAIEFDTYQNGGCNTYGGTNDPAYDHTTIVYNGDICYPKISHRRIHSSKDNVEDNSCYSSEIRWRPGTGGQPDLLELYIEGVLRISHSDYMIQNIFKTTSVYYGFTGSTGGLSNEQTICIFQGNSNPVAKDDIVSTPFGNAIKVDVQANDSDIDGDKLFTTQILVAPKNGTATIIDKDSIRYVPNAGFAGLDEFQYRVCDIDPTVTGGEKCYANCSNAWVRLSRVECPTYNLELKKNNDNYKCDNTLPNNGAAEAILWNGTVKVTSGITFRWYLGSYDVPAQVAGITPYFVGPSVTGMQDATYTVFAQFNGSCFAAPVRITIARNQDKPNFQIGVNRPFTSCTAPDGSVQVNFTDPLISPSNYTYRWYEVGGTVPVSYSRVFSNAQAKTYRVVVTHTISGCFEEGTVTVPGFVFPSINTSSTPVTQCTTLNGSLSANVGGSTSGYSFIWARRNNPAFADPVFTGPIYSNLDTGLYYLRVRHISSGCIVGETSARVQEGRVYPVINSFMSESQTSCNINAPNGTLDITNIDNGKPLGNYTYAWYKGDNVIVPLESTKYSAHKTYNLPAGDYTLVVKSKSTGCETRKLFTIVEELETGNMTINGTVVNQTNCSPANGRISVSTTYTGSATAPKTYSYRWWKGENVLLSTTPDYTGAAITGLTAGKYTVLVTSNTLCTLQETFTVNDELVYPTVTLTPVDNSSCEPARPIGSISASVSPAGTYSYQWFAGSGTSSPLTTSTTNIISNLPSNTYTLRVTNTATGCSTLQYATINNIVAPAVTVTFPVPSAITCNNMDGVSNGTVSANVGGNTTDYNFYWYTGQVVKTTPDFTGAQWTNRSKGYYTVVAESKTTFCKSEPFSQLLIEDLPQIEVEVNETTVSTCLEEGDTKLIAVPPAPSVTADYSFAWFLGEPDLATYPYFSYAPIGTTAVLDQNILPGIYTVRAVHNVTKCVSLGKRDLRDKSTAPVITNYITTNNTRCATPNGQIRINEIRDGGVNISISPAGVIDPNYPIRWVKKTDATSPWPPAFDWTNTSGNSNNAIHSNLTAGTYGAIIKRVDAQCPSVFMQFVITDELNYPIVQVTPTHKTNCRVGTESNGAISLKVNNFSGNTADYNINWGGASTNTATFSIDTWTLTGVDVGTYTISITNNSGCTTSRSVTISPNHVTPTAAVTLVNNTTCEGGGINSSGSIRVNSPVNTWVYNWYNSSNLLIHTGPDLLQRVHGQYYLIVTNPATGCSSNRIEREILDRRTYPIVQVKSTENQTRCDIANDGAVTIALTPGTNYSNAAVYRQPFTWTFNGSPLTPAPILTNTTKEGSALLANEFRALNLAAGDYTLTITRTISNCPITVSFTIDYVPVKPTLTKAFTSHSDCPPNGTASITSTFPLASITWTTLVDGVESPRSEFNNQASLTGLSAGNYVVRAVDSKGCESYPYDIEIKDERPLIFIILSRLINNSSCNGVPNGSLEVELESGYTYRWESTTSIIKASEQNTNLITGLAAGTYTVTKRHQATGCEVNDTFVIQDIPFTFDPQIFKKPINRCLPPYDGNLMAYVNGETSPYTFIWKNLGTNETNPNPTWSDLPAGKYELTVTHILTGCVSTRVIDLEFEALPFNVVFNEDVPLTSCYPTKPNAQASANVGGRVAGYDFKWYKGTFISDLNLVSTTNIADKLGDETYTLVVRDLATDCEKNVTYRPLPNAFVVSPPTVNVTPNTRCISDLYPANGTAEASVNENTSQYRFSWHTQNNIRVDTDSSYYQEGLASGTYFVRATDRITGCISAPTAVVIVDAIEKLTIDPQAKPSMCYEDNGQAYISMIMPSTLTVDVLTTVSGTTEYSGDYLYDLPYGDYKVTVVANNGCTTVKDFTIGAEYVVYNGISPNGDGENDFLAIDCIDMFPNNLVKIYNRAGALVFEMRGYKNESDALRFDGFGNRGIYMTGKYLPDGTYYYVIDKGDGSRPKAGFIELLR